MSEPNYAGNIIANLAGLPDFLRRPILTRRLGEFFTMGPAEQREIVSNALEAGPDIPFGTFEKLCRTWLEVLCTFEPAQREAIFTAYLERIAADPASIVRFNLDGVLGIFLSLDGQQREAIGGSIAGSVRAMQDGPRGTILKLMPESAKRAVRL